jgi:hypothetical protein
LTLQCETHPGRDGRVCDQDLLTSRLGKADVVVPHAAILPGRVKAVGLRGVKCDLVAFLTLVPANLPGLDVARGVEEVHADLKRARRRLTWACVAGEYERER